MAFLSCRHTKYFEAVLSKVPQPATQTTYNVRIFFVTLIRKQLNTMPAIAILLIKKGVTLCFALLLLSSADFKTSVVFACREISQSLENFKGKCMLEYYLTMGQNAVTNIAFMEKIYKQAVTRTCWMKYHQSGDF